MCRRGLYPQVRRPRRSLYLRILLALVGTVLASLIAFLATFFAMTRPAQVSLLHQFQARRTVALVLDAKIVLLALLFSAAVGVVFGSFPARRAASLNPIDGLRHE